MSDKIKVGIWGLGRAGLNMHIPELQKYPEMYEIFSGMDTDAEHRKIFTEKAGAKTYDNEGAFLNDPDVEMISIATLKANVQKPHCVSSLQ